MRKKTRGVLYANFAILAIAALLYAALVSPVSVTAMAQSRSFPVYRGSSKTEICLQCAVTWDASAMDGILDVLKENGVCITFAVSGSWAENDPRLLKRIADEGHEIAVMGFEPEKDGSLPFVTRDVSASLDTVRQIAGVSPSIYYCGSRDSGISARAANSLGLTTVLGTADLDCSSADAELILKRLENCAAPGSIILVQPTASFFSALPGIINYLKNMGLAIVPVHKMLYN